MAIILLHFFSSNDQDSRRNWEALGSLESGFIELIVSQSRCLTMCIDNENRPH